MLEEIKNEPLPEIRWEDIKLFPIENIHIEAMEVCIPDSEPIILEDEVLSLPLNERIKL